MRAKFVRNERGMWNYDDGPTTPEQTDADHAAQQSTSQELRRDRPLGTIWPAAKPRDRKILECQSVLGQVGFLTVQEELFEELGRIPEDYEVRNRMTYRAELLLR